MFWRRQTAAQNGGNGNEGNGNAPRMTRVPPALSRDSRSALNEAFFHYFKDMLPGIPDQQKRHERAEDLAKRIVMNAAFGFEQMAIVEEDRELFIKQLENEFELEIRRSVMEISRASAVNWLLDESFNWGIKAWIAFKGIAVAGNVASTTDQWGDLLPDIIEAGKIHFADPHSFIVPLTLIGGKVAISIMPKIRLDKSDAKADVKLPTIPQKAGKVIGWVASLGAVVEVWRHSAKYAFERAAETGQEAMLRLKDVKNGVVDTLKGIWEFAKSAVEFLGKVGEVAADTSILAPGVFVFMMGGAFASTKKFRTSLEKRLEALSNEDRYRYVLQVINSIRFEDESDLPSGGAPAGGEPGPINGDDSDLELPQEIGPQIDYAVLYWQVGMKMLGIEDMKEMIVLTSLASGNKERAMEWLRWAGHAEDYGITEEVFDNAVQSLIEKNLLKYEEEESGRLMFTKSSLRFLNEVNRHQINNFAIIAEEILKEPGKTVDAIVNKRGTGLEEEELREYGQIIE
ncbi:hypothetical protein DRN67_01175, partial [Candidatus Micrarchaeota archaeon]